MAPEMLKKDTKFNEKIESWSLGIILFEMLFQRTPFDSISQKRVIKKIKAFKELDFHNPFWNNLSFEAKDLLD